MKDEHPTIFFQICSSIKIFAPILAQQQKHPTKLQIPPTAAKTDISDAHTAALNHARERLRKDNKFQSCNIVAPVKYLYTLRRQRIGPAHPRRHQLIFCTFRR